MRASSLAFAFLLASMAVTPAVAQATDFDAIGLSTVPFNFSPPGARPLGMGAAFVGLADDAVASEANPAGLTILTRPEISFHVKSSAYDVQAIDLLGEIFFTSNANATGSPIATFDDSVTSPSFASFVYPLKSGRAAFSVYYLETINFTGTSTQMMTTPANPGAVPPLAMRTGTSMRDVDFTLRNVGFSFGVKLGKGVSLGASVRGSELSATNRDSLMVTSTNPADPALPAFPIIIATNDSDTTATYNVGLKIDASDKVSVGLVYKDNGKYNLDVVSMCGTPPAACDPNIDSRFDVDIPDVLAAGVAIRPTDRVVIVADLDWITYSDIGLKPSDFTGLFPPIVNPLEEVDDALEVHAGFEYTFFAGKQKQTPVFLRGGVWNDPDHDNSIRIDSDQVHFSLGTGVVIKQSIQFDLAFQFADTVNEGLLSFVYRF